ncbi:hypothetical protein BCR35DRAFT_332941 [Leucosporidium creatinivorum]|uniref:Uncharacterized protein n=1 Tax=Leucosporidium creatinivorum TaxID=106004 RepID=A0A1Y2EXH5_9BASI|nr:hypothetical protein BCR35DRAFT_332941 [Leucosporidium creatinivorum]
MKYEDWEDEATIISKYYSEVETLLKNVTGASKVIIFDHTIRRGEKEGEETPDTPESRKPVSRVHVDQTPMSGRRRVERHASSPAEAERLLRAED